MENNSIIRFLLRSKTYTFLKAGTVCLTKLSYYFLKYCQTWLDSYLRENPQAVDLSEAPLMRVRPSYIEDYEGVETLFSYQGFNSGYERLYSRQPMYEVAPTFLGYKWVANNKYSEKYEIIMDTFGVSRQLRMSEEACEALGLKSGFLYDNMWIIDKINFDEGTVPVVLAKYSDSTDKSTWYPPMFSCEQHADYWQKQWLLRTCNSEEEYDKALTLWESFDDEVFNALYLNK